MAKLHGRPLGRVMAPMLMASLLGPATASAQQTATKPVTQTGSSTSDASPSPSPRPRLSRARVLTGAGLLIGGVASLAFADADRRLARDDRRLFQIQGVGSLGAGALVLALSRRHATSDDEDEAAVVEPEAPKGRSQAFKWTGIGLLIGGGVFTLGSFTFNDSKGCGFANEHGCNNVGRVYRSTAALLLGSGVTLLVLDDVHRRRSKQLSLSLSPRAVRVNVLF